MSPHTFESVDPKAFDANCRICEGKLRDAIHGATDEIREASQRPAEIQRPITSRIVDTCGSDVCEIEYTDATGAVVGYWAYGEYDRDLPYQGEQGRRP